MQKKLRTTMYVLSIGLILGFAAGCDGGGEPDCTAVTNPCTELSALQCSSDGAAIEVCLENEDGCFQWSIQTECPAGEQCDDSAGEPACGCVDACPTDGATRCSSTAIQECQEGTSGCLGWVEIQDCADTSMVCDASGGSAQCVAGCTDACTAEGLTDCRGTIIRTCTMGADLCLAWVEGMDCADAGEVCNDDSGTAQCVAGCVDACTTAGATQCNGTVIETCATGTDGCLAWTPGTDCNTTGEVCNDDSGTAQCVAGCVDECTTAAETQCGGTVIQTCTEGTEGCLEWVDGQDCAATGQNCDDTAEPAICSGVLGDSCATAQVIAAVPFTKSGTDFAADYADDVAFTDASCTARTTGQADAVFALNLTTGQEVVVWELGGLDAVVSIQSTCANDAVCLVSGDFGYLDGPARYTATADGTVYIIIEAWSDTPTTRDYEISVDIAVAENCGDSIDNDLDDLTDCDDPDCFGDATYCATETNCGDEADNDGDTLVDCLDTVDCSADPWCGPYKGYWQEFGTGDLVDVTGHSLVFTPSTTDTNLYTWAETSGVTAYPVTPGSGTTTTPLTLGDDANAPYTFGGTTSFTFFGNAYTSLYVGSNGFITFGAGDTDYTPSLTDFFDLPRIALFWADLNPSLGGTVTVDEFADSIVVTFDAVPRASSTTELISVQAILSTDASTTPGEIEIVYLSVTLTDRGMIGIGSGTGDGTTPVETDFFAPPPPPPPTINEVAYDNNSTDTREFVEIHGNPGDDLSAYTLVHFNGSSGLFLWTINLTGAVIPADGLLVIGSTITPNVDITWASVGVVDSGALQNDGETVVLYTGWDGATGTAVDAVAYETDTNQFGEGTPSVGVTVGAWQTSIGRFPDGQDTNDNLTDLPIAWWPTPGEPNTPGQPSGFGRDTGSVNDTANVYPVAIPDNNPAGISLAIDATSHAAWMPAAVGNIYLGVKIRHTWRGDLSVSLTSPAGTTVLLHNRTGSGADNLMTVYDLATPVADTVSTMDSFNTQAALGIWTLTVSDNGSGDTGSVEEWVLWIAP